MTEHNDSHAANVTNARRWGCIFVILAGVGIALAGILYLIAEG